MPADWWQTRLLYMAMSAFVAWHSAALLVAPAPATSAIAQSLRAVFDPYLTMLGLDNQWSFYAPNIGWGRQFRYAVEDAEGRRHNFAPAEHLSWYHPGYWWFRAWHDAIMTTPDLYGAQVAAQLCRDHASLKPVSVSLIRAQQGEFWPEDHLAGHRPMDPDFLSEEILSTVKCKS